MEKLLANTKDRSRHNFRSWTRKSSELAAFAPKSCDSGYENRTLIDRTILKGLPAKNYHTYSFHRSIFLSQRILMSSLSILARFVVRMSDLKYTGILILLLLSGCGGYGPSEYQQLKQKLDGFSDVIKAAGGKATKEGKSLHGFQMAGWLIDLTNAKITDELIDHIIVIGKSDPVFQLNLSNSNITNEQLAKLDAGNVLQKTIDLNLSNTPINDAGLDKLSNFYCVTDLNLTGSAATAVGAKRMGSKQISNSNTPAPFKKQPKLKI